MVIRVTLATALLAFGTLAAPAQTLNTAKLDNLPDNMASHDKLLGSLALAHDGQVVYRRAFGAARLAPKVAATPARTTASAPSARCLRGCWFFSLSRRRS